MKVLSKVRGMGRLSKVGIVLGSLGLAAVIAAGPASAAVTSTGATTTVTGKSAVQNGNATQVTHYSISYTDPIFGPVNCVGVHQVKGTSVQDSFTCTSTTGSPLSNVTAGQPLALGTAPTWWGWYSDFNGAAAQSLSGTVSATGMSYTAVATY
jgi:hypothetical protein